MSLTPKGQITREGRVCFGDASLSVWEEGISAARAAGGYNGVQQWERQFKHDVFKRIIQTLNRLGWTVEPQTYIRTGDHARFCHKGELKADLHISGRCIEFEMFQSVNCPTRPDHEGRYESDKEKHMPYLLRLEMERTRRRIRDYLCNVFTDYQFDPKSYSIYSKPLQQTAMEWIQQRYAESSHFKGDWPAYLAKERWMDGNRKSADGVMLEHGQRVWTTDWHGRVIAGIAYYNINNMWWVWLGKYDYTNKACFELYASAPENLRIKRNTRQRRKRLEGELSKAIKAMNFERAALLRDILFPKGEELFVVWHSEHKAYHCANFSGYTTNINDAGKFTAAEVKGYSCDPNEVRPLDAA